MRRRILLLVVSCWITSAVFAESPAPTEYRITGIEGQVGVIPKGGTVASPAVKDFTLEPGDHVVTNAASRVELAARNGSVIQLEQNSTLELQDSPSIISRFYLSVGKLLAKFSKASEGNSYQVKTPVAVAAVRGTELAVCVEEDGATEAGVIEGQVAFTPADETTSEPETVVDTNGGMIAKPQQKIVKTIDLPPLVRTTLNRFPHLRERAELVRAEWKDLPPLKRTELRREVLSHKIQWVKPEKLSPTRIAPERRDPVRSPRKKIGE